MAGLKYFTDEHIPLAVVDQIRERGADIVRVEDLDWKGESDLTLLEFAIEEERCLMTGDDDFLAHHANWMAEGRSHYGVFYIHPQVRQQRKAAAGIIVIRLWRKKPRS